MSTIIHIGMQKTGTTFLQKALCEARDQLLQHNVLYHHPTAGLPGAAGAVNAHHWLAHAIMERRKRYTPAAGFHFLEQHLAGLKKEAVAYPKAVSVLSSEEFSLFGRASISRLRELFPAEDTRILVYLRRQDLWLDSYYAQMVKVGREITPEALYKQEKWRLDYLSWLDMWAARFGAENLIVRAYDDFGPDNSIWDDFLRVIGRPNAASVRPRIAAANQSLSYELTLFSKAQHIYGEHRGLRNVFESLNGHFLKRAGLKYISEGMARSIIEAFAEGNDRVAQKHLGRPKLFDTTIRTCAGEGTLSVDQVSQIIGGITIQVLGRVNKLEEQLREMEIRLASKRANYPLLYATRSLLPSNTANSVQSTHMACAFDQLHTDFTAVYRSSVITANSTTHFGAYGLNPPRRAHALRAYCPWLDWTHPDLKAFGGLLRRQPRETIVYTRSARLSWVSASQGFPTFIELHDPLTKVRAAWLRHLLHTRRLPGLVATTARLKADLLAALPALTDKHILVAGGAASVALLELPAATLPEAREFNVGYAGSAFRGKGIEVLLACAAAEPSMAFHVIGPDRDACARLGTLSPNIIFHGRKSHPETIGLLKSMDALLLPNQRSVIIRSGADIGAHTSPLKLFEYLATGRPIIASDLPVFNGILRNQDNALLTPPEDINGFCQHLRRLKEEPAVGYPLGARARLDFTANHTWEHRARRILEFITGLAPSGARF
jgi:glycosyltransferase involved in cell wall biosynthesis